MEDTRMQLYSYLASPTYPTNPVNKIENNIHTYIARLSILGQQVRGSFYYFRVTDRHGRSFAMNNLVFVLYNDTQPLGQVKTHCAQQTVHGINGQGWLQRKRCTKATGAKTGEDESFSLLQQLNVAMSLIEVDGSTEATREKKTITHMRNKL